MSDIDRVPPLVPSSPTPSTMALVEDVVRSVLLLASGLGFYHGSTSDSVVYLVASALLFAASAAWGLYVKYRDKGKDHVGSVMSAKLQKPVQPAPSS